LEELKKLSGREIAIPSLAYNDNIKVTVPDNSFMLKEKPQEFEQNQAMKDYMDVPFSRVISSINSQRKSTETNISKPDF
jgi:hypothetical protein